MPRSAERQRPRRPRRRRVKPHRSFDPRRVGSLECDAWVAYYQREWVTFLRSAVALTHDTFGLPWPSTIRGAWLVKRANQLWAPFPDNDPDGARRAMARFYQLVCRTHGETFDPVTGLPQFVGTGSVSWVAFCLEIGGLAVAGAEKV